MLNMDPYALYIQINALQSQSELNGIHSRSFAEHMANIFRWNEREKKQSGEGSTVRWAMLVAFGGITLLCVCLSHPPRSTY